MTAVMEQAARPSRGYVCNVCNQFGDHFARDCPKRGTVGVPEVLQQTKRRRSDNVPGSVASEASSLERADELPSYLTLEDVVRRRGDIPRFLRCHVCGRLPTNVLWVSCCDMLVCRECLGPFITDAHPACPSCDTVHEDNTPVFHVVSAMRHVVTAWFHASMANIDPVAAKALLNLAAEGDDSLDVAQLALAQERARVHQEKQSRRRPHRTVCRYWTQGRCTAGDKCKFSHHFSNDGVQLCVFIDGTCPDGNNCRFRHYRLPHEKAPATT